MTQGDLAFAAHLHRTALPNGLFPTLGPRFLRIYLFTYAASPFGLAYVALVDQRPVAFLVGCHDHRAHRSHVLRHFGPRLVLAGAAALTRRPRVAWRFLRTRSRKYLRALVDMLRRRAEASAASHRQVAVLSHVAVADAVRGAGVGSVLVDRFVRDVGAAGAHAAGLLTKADDGGAGAFYERLGWCPTDVVTDRDGVEWVRYRLELR